MPARTAHDGLPCYLETFRLRNVSFYISPGFLVIHEGIEPVSTLPFWTFATTRPETRTKPLVLHVRRCAHIRP